MWSILLAQDASNTAATAAAGGIFIVIFLIEIAFILAVLAFFVWIYWRIAAKMGYNPALSLLLLVPIANLVILIMCAFGKWPIEEERDALRAQLGHAPPGTGLTTT